MTGQSERTIRQSVDEHNPAAVGYTTGQDAAPAPPVPAGGLEWREREATLRGSHPGDRYVRVARHVAVGRGAEVAITARAPESPRTGAGRAFHRVKRTVIGQPLTSAQAAHERLTKIKALAILSSDALSSVAYATEETMLVLVLAGTAAFQFSIPISLSIVALLAIVAFSYRQTIFSYPSGGGSYIVASDNLGRLPGLTAGASLLIDYVLTVAVSISSGVAALTSAVPALTDYTVLLCLAFIALITLGNLRGIRDSGSIFAAPTYLFIGSLLALIGIGLVRVFVLRDPLAVAVPRDPLPGGHALTLFLILRAFASGCTAMTGVEAISNGVPAFKQPESRNAAATMVWMAGLLSVMFLGTTILAHQYGLVPREGETLLSQLARQVVGDGWFYYVIQVATLLVLVLAANTCYADFPRLSSILARDRFLPRQFAFRGDRLAFSVGIGALSALAAILVVIFRGDVSALIPLYAVGVFLSFTLSQSGMVVHWWRERGRRWAAKALVNGVGAAATGVVTLVIAATKLISGEPLFQIGAYHVHAGAWLVIVLIPFLVANFLAIHRHYETAERELATETPLDPQEIRHTVIVPIAALNRVALQTLAYACSFATNVTAVHVSDDTEAIAALRRAWREQTAAVPFLQGVKLVAIESPYRSLTGPLLAFIDESDRHDPHDTLTVILPEFVPAHWWEQFLHNQSALRLKAALLFRPGTVVTSVPHHLRRAA